MILLLIFLASFVGGTNTPLVKFNVQIFPPVFVAFIRFFLAFFLILPFAIRGNILSLKKINSDLVFVNILFAVNILLFVFAIGGTSVIVAQIAYLLTPVFVLIIAYLYLREKVSFSKIVGLAFSMLGMLILFLGSVKTADVHTFGTPWGNFLVILAVFVWSTYTVLSRRISNKYSPLKITTYNFIVTAGLSAVILPFQLTVHSLKPSSFNGLNVAALFAMALFSTVAFFFLYQKVIKETSAFVATLINYLATVVAASIGIIFFGEQLTLSLIFGCALVVFGAIIATSVNKLNRQIKYA